jgi:hypothetical protein
MVLIERKYTCAAFSVFSQNHPVTLERGGGKRKV